jgi:hypothetical protein
MLPMRCFLIANSKPTLLLASGNNFRDQGAAIIECVNSQYLPCHDPRKNWGLKNNAELTLYVIQQTDLIRIQVLCSFFRTCFKPGVKNILHP